MTVPGSATGSRVTPGRVPDEPRRAGHTALYRFFGSDGDLLYVGITKRLEKRLQEHAVSSSWWSKATAHSIEWYASRTAAGRAERTAIRDEKPTHNIMHTPRNRVPLGERIGRETVSGERGDSLLLELKEHFQGRFFTAADALKISQQCESAVQKNIRALAIRKEIIPVGTRSVVTSGIGRRTSALYTLPVHEWVDGSTGRPLPPDQIPDIIPKPRPPKEARFVREAREVQQAPRPAPDPQALPPFVTFASGATLLISLGLVDDITGDGIRYIARTSDDWPFGDGRPHPYGKAASARTMDAIPFVDFFRTGVRRGGRGRPSRSRFFPQQNPEGEHSER